MWDSGFTGWQIQYIPYAAALPARAGKYHMYIDSELIDGNLTYGELVLPGKRETEIFFSTYLCHPSMANNECSEPALMAELIQYVKSMSHRKYTYRFVMIPETIGSIAYLSTEEVRNVLCFCSLPIFLLAHGSYVFMG